MTDQKNIAVDLLVVGSGTGMSAALAAHELGLSTLIVEKTGYVGGSTARSGGAFWLPGSSILKDNGSADTADRARIYLEALVGADAAPERSRTFVDHIPATIEMLRRTTP